MFINQFRGYFADSLESLNIFLHSNIDDALNLLTEVFQTSASHTKSIFPSRSFTRAREKSQPPWWDDELEQLKQEKYRALRAHRDVNLDLNVFRQLRNHLVLRGNSL